MPKAAVAQSMRTSYNLEAQVRSRSHWRAKCGVALTRGSTHGWRPHIAAGRKGTASVPERRPAARRLNLVAADSNLRAIATEDRAWVAKARCATTDPDELFVRGAAQRKAAVICRDCPVVQQCGAHALDHHVKYGVWGGMTERQRRALLKQHPEVVSWADFFTTHSVRSVG